MAKSKNDSPVEVKKDEKKNTANFSFADSDMMQKNFGSDIEPDEEVTVTVKGKITSSSFHKSKDWNDASVGIDFTSISVTTKKDDENKEEMNDMMKE